MPSADSVSDEEFYEVSSDSKTGTVVLWGAVTSAQVVGDDKVAKAGDNEAAERTLAKKMQPNRKMVMVTQAVQRSIQIVTDSDWRHLGALKRANSER